MIRFTVEAYNLPLGTAGVSHFRVGDRVISKLHNNQYVVDYITFTCDEGFGTSLSMDLHPWSEQATSVMRVGMVWPVDGEMP
jgi:hypothetical protein